MGAARTTRRRIPLLLIVAALCFGMACSPTSAPTGSTPVQPIGTRDRPIRMAFVPSLDAQTVLSTAQPLADALNRETGLYFDVSVPTSYTAVIEAMGAGQVDVAWLATFAYVLAHEKYGTEVMLSTVRQGSKTYRSQIITRSDSGIRSIQDLRGKKFAFVDSVSASGFLYPVALLAKNSIDYKSFFAETVNAGGHDKVVIAVYNRQVDAGATFGNSIETGAPTDARTLVASTIPDVMQQVVPIAVTDPIPNDTVSVRRGVDPATTARIRSGLLKLSESADGQKLLRDLYNINGLAEVTDADYSSVREAARVLNLDLEEQIKPRS